MCQASVGAKMACRLLVPADHIKVACSGSARAKRIAMAFFRAPKQMQIANGLISSYGSCACMQGIEARPQYVSELLIWVELAHRKCHCP